MLPVLFMVSALLMTVQPNWEWQSFPETGFKILTPTVLSHEVREVPTPASIILFHQYHGGSLNDTMLSMAFVIDHYILPGDEVVSDDDYKREFFENTIDELLVSLEGTLLYMDVVHHADRDVCIWKGSFMHGAGVIRGHTVLSGNKYFGLQAFGMEKNNPDEEMDKFLNSFKFLET